MYKTYLWISCLLLMLLAGCTNTKKKTVAEQEETTFTNPVIYSDEKTYHLAVGAD